MSALAVGIFLALAAGFSPAPLAQEGAREMPEPTTEGQFVGTWYYVDPGYQIALFITRGKSGPLRLRYHVRNKKGLEFETNAQGVARFLDDGAPVELIFRGAVAADKRFIEGHYRRSSASKTSRYTESGNFKLFRAYDGRTMVLQYPEYTVQITDAKGQTKTSTRGDRITIFRKASDLILDFAEIPF